MKILFSSLVFFLALQSNAIVDMKNANYSNTWTDLEVQGTGYDLKVARTYNSRTLFNGIFGFGWCSDFETSLEIMPEGTLRVKECGAGAEAIFSTKEINPKEVASSISQIITKMKADKKNTFSEEYYKKLSSQMSEDNDKRAEYARKYGITIPIKEGIKYSINGKEVESIILNKGLYTRTLPDGTMQRFSTQGKLTHMYNKNGNYIKIDYDANGTIKEVADESNRKLTFKYYQHKKVKTISGPNGLVAEYKYVNFDDLGSAKNAWGNTFTYEYNEFHNMTKSVWPDKTFVNIKYDDKKDWVTSFTDRDNCTETYAYDSSPKDPNNHYWSTVKKVCGKEVVAENKYEFWHKQRSDGQYYLERVLTSINGSTNDIVYHEVFGRPISIRKNNEKVNFEYYPDGQVKVKFSELVKMSFEYDKETKKVSSVTSQFFDDKKKPISSKNSQFKYDQKGNLIYAQNSDGQKINMTYDNKGRISTITDQAKKVVKIEYEERHGKPAVVTRPGLGTIQVSYKNNGDINKVESKDGPTVAMQVASTFNNLLDIIAPATAELYQ